MYVGYIDWSGAIRVTCCRIVFRDELCMYRPRCRH